MKTIKFWFIAMVIMAFVSCEGFKIPKNAPTSSSGVTKAEVHISTGMDGLTVEQRNVRQRLIEDNQFGVIKHLYVISAYSGDVIIYSTVRGKVTSSGKRLNPTEVGCTDGQYVDNLNNGISVRIGNRIYNTPEVLQDDGTYGSSAEYVYWWDSKDVYHQHYITGGQIFHVTSEPLNVNKVVINLDPTWGK